MTKFVDVKLAKKWLRIDHNEDDQQIADMIEMASSAIMTHTHMKPEMWKDENGEDIEPPAALRFAVKLILDELYDGYGGQQKPMLKNAKTERSVLISPNVEALLEPFTRPPI